MPTRQMRKIADGIEQHREQIHRLQEQLALFDDQLKLFGDSLIPLLDWRDQWSKAQETMLKQLRPPKKSR